MNEEEPDVSALVQALLAHALETFFSPEENFRETLTPNGTSEERDNS